MSEDASFTDDQPKDGDKVLHCGHHKAKSHHFFQTSGEQNAVGPDGDVHVDWAIACDVCALKAVFSPTSIEWKEYYTWSGDEPIIEKWPQ